MPAKLRIEQSVPLDPFTFLIQHLVAFSSGHFSNWGWLAVAAILYTMIVLLGSGIPTQLRSRPKYNSISQSPVTGVSRDLLLGLYLLVPLSFAYLVNLFFPFHPIHYERLLLLASPPFFLIAAAGIDRLWQMHIRYGMASLTLLLGFATLSLYDLYTVPRYPDDDYRPLISTLQQGAKPGDILIGIYPWQIGYLETYYEGAPLHVVQADNDSWVSDPQKMEQQLGAWSVNSKRIWLPALQTKGRVLEDALDAYLRPRNYAVLDTWFGTTRLELFALLDDPPVAQTTLHLPDSADKTVHYGFAANQAIVGGDILPVWFDYSEQNESSYKFSLRLDDRAGNVWAQEDREIEKGRQRVGFGIPAGTPPGDYQLLISFYASNNTPSKSSKPEGLGQVNIISPSEPILRAIPKRTRALFENGVELLGYSAGDAPAQPGQTNGIGLYWQSRSSQLSDVEVRIRLDDSKGHSYLISQSVPAHGIYPLPQWKPNEVVFDPHTFQLSGNAPDGTYSVLVGLFDTKTQQIVRTAGTKEWASIGTIEVKARPRYFGRPSPSHPFSADFGGWARLIGYDLVRATEAVQIVLYWQALGTPPNSYTVFTHLLGPDGKIRGQRDQIPGDGAYPTTTWVPGEYLIDTYRINSPLLAGDQLEIGMYNPSSGERVPLMDGLNSRQDDHINLPVPSN